VLSLSDRAYHQLVDPDVRGRIQNELHGPRDVL
jgi:hypothetical protein